MRKNVLITQLITAALIVYYMAMQFWSFRRDPVEYLSDPLRLYQIPMWISLLLACLYELWFYFNWTHKAIRMAEEDGVFLPIKSNIKANYVLLAFSTLSATHHSIKIGIRLFHPENTLVPGTR